MSILINSGSRILVQGLTGHEGMFHARQMLEYGTDIVAGCTPGKGGTDVEIVNLVHGGEEAAVVEGEGPRATSEAGVRCGCPDGMFDLTAATSCHQGLYVAGIKGQGILVCW